MAEFVEWVVFSLLRYLLSLSIIMFLLFPLIRFALIGIFEQLPRAGFAGIFRRLLAFPVVGLLSKERQARRGNQHSLFQLFLCQLAGAFIVSLVIQSFLSTLIYTLVFSFFAYRVTKLGRHKFTPRLTILRRNNEFSNRYQWSARSSTA